mgnify:FL=1
MFSVWLKSSSNQLDEIKNLIHTISEQEKTDYIDPHVTLVTNLQTEESGKNYLDKIVQNKFDIIFNKIQEGTTFFQRLYLTADDNTDFFNSVIEIEGWPSLWTPHLSLYYGNELPNSFPSKSFDNIIPITVTFDTLGLYKTGPIVSEWKEITTLFLD